MKKKVTVEIFDEDGKLIARTITETDEEPTPLLPQMPNPNGVWTYPVAKTGSAVSGDAPGGWFPTYSQQ